MDTVQLWVQVRRRDIAFLCNLVGSYEGLGVVRTLDATRGILELMIAPAFYDTALALLHDLARKDVPLRTLKQPAPDLRVSAYGGIPTPKASFPRKRESTIPDKPRIKSGAGSGLPPTRE